MRRTVARPGLPVNTQLWDVKSAGDGPLANLQRVMSLCGLMLNAENHGASALLLILGLIWLSVPYGKIQPAADISHGADLPQLSPGDVARAQ